MTWWVARRPRVRRPTTQATISTRETPRRPLATIQHALNRAEDGDTVRLLPGNYTGGSDCNNTVNPDGFFRATQRRCNYNLNFMGKSVILQGSSSERPEDTVIDCEADEAPMSAPRRALSCSAVSHRVPKSGV